MVRAPPAAVNCPNLRFGSAASRAGERRQADHLTRPAVLRHVVRCPHRNPAITVSKERTMSLAVRRLKGPLGAEILGADLRGPPDRELIDTVNAAMAEHAVVVLRGQAIGDEEQLRFSRAFGPLELPPAMGVSLTRKRRVRPEMYDVSNLDEHGDFLPPESLQHASNRANEEFHTDSSFNALPTKWSLLSARILPPVGADTEFVDTRQVYDALPHDLRTKAADAVAEHWFWKTRSRAGFVTVTEEMRRAMPPVSHPVVRVIPESGRKALYIGNHATHILGWPREEGAQFLETLNAFATQPRFVHAHRWCDGDLVIWDNRCTVHRATKYDVFRYKRDLRRTTINESGPEMSSTDALKMGAPTAG
jgi:alpha-ketoglutarate-dependent 2,4-dichlorophenoxyacetate dioxygenase